MLNKTQKNAKAKTASAHNSRFIFFTILFALSVVVLAIVAWAKPETDESKPAANCTEYVSMSEMFHCNITELEYVVEPAQRQLGLSGRENLAGNQGMVFVFDQPSEICMWMKDMKFAIDIVWLDDNGKIIKLLKDVRPETYPTRFCAQDTRYVLEVNSGVMNKMGIGVGDSIRL